MVLRDGVINKITRTVITFSCSVLGHTARHTGSRERIGKDEMKYLDRDTCVHLEMGLGELRLEAGAAVICAQCHSRLGLFMINFLLSSVFAEISSK